MKTIITILLLSASMAYADGCSFQSYFINGKLITCTTCCYSGNCSTSCL